MKTTVTHMVGRREIELDIIYSASKGYAGDYFQPPEAPEIQIDSITHEGKEFNLSHEETEQLIEVLYEGLEQALSDEAAEWGDYAYEQYRDRMWEDEQ